MTLNNNSNEYVSFTMGGIHFEYDEAKNQKNIEKHGISFKSAARVFFDYDMQQTLKGGFIMVNISDMTASAVSELVFTEEELKELELARKKEIVFDEECPETTPERALRFRRVNPPRNLKRA